MAGDCSTPETDFKFPDCWENDMRRSALFAPFRAKALNPTDWDSKMKFWTSLIENWCKYNKCPVVEISSLKKSFTKKGCVPACLEDVLAYMKSSRILVDKKNFMAPNDSWQSWAVKALVTNPLKWTFNTVKNTIITKNGEGGVYYVHLTVVKHLSEELKKIASTNYKGKIVSFEELMQWGFESPENLSIVLHWMQKQGMAAVCHKNDITLVKLLKNSAKPLSVTITETDIGIYSLEKQQKLLEENIKKLEAERDAALEETKQYVAKKMKSLARETFRRKKQLDNAIEKRAITLNNVQAILHQIEQAKLDSEVIEIYRKGINTLKQIFKETGLNAETVTDTMDELEKVLNSRKDIEESLARPMDEDLSTDLEEELAELLLNNAPDVCRDELPAVSAKEKKKSKDADEVAAKMEALSI